MDRQGWARGLVTAGSTPPPGHWCRMRRRDQARDRACSAQPRPAPPFLRCWEDLRLRGLAKKWSWGGAVERSAVLKPPLFSAPQSRTTQTPPCFAQTPGISPSPGAEPLPAKRVSLQKSWLEPRPAIQKRGPTPARGKTTEVTPSQRCGEGSSLLALPQPTEFRLLSPQLKPSAQAGFYIISRDVVPLDSLSRRDPH